MFEILWPKGVCGSEPCGNNFYCNGGKIKKIVILKNKQCNCTILQCNKYIKHVISEKLKSIIDPSSHVEQKSAKNTRQCRNGSMPHPNRF